MKAATPPAAELSAEQVAQMLAAAQTRPALPALEWEGEAEPLALASELAPAPARPALAQAEADEDPPATYSPMRRRIRDRYIGVRFAGIARSGEDLADPHRVIKAARLAFQEEKPGSALELLDLAIEQDRRERSFRLAQLEILFLLRSRARFTEGARRFHGAFPDDPAWDEVARLGRAVAPDEPLFGTSPSTDAGNSYGPWPNLPNWIEAPWDLTAEVRAADFHRSMAEARPILIA